MRLASWVACAGILLGLVAGPGVAPSLAQEAAAADGRAIFLAAKCHTCHAVPSQGIEAKVASEKTKGPDITGIASEPELLGQFLRKQAERNEKAHQKEFKGTDEELKILVAWLLEQK